MLPYRGISESADRRWTFRLLERLGAPELPEDELDGLVAALQACSDPRSVGPLEALLCDTSRPARIREAASAVLTGMDYPAPDVAEDKLRRWWREGDALLRRHALFCMDRIDCPDIVLQVATDRGHELHAEAIGRMIFFFDLPEHEAIKIAALSHPDPKVRQAAADVLFWDEPIRAEGPLLRATADPVSAVAEAAVNTLQYYHSQKALRCLHGLQDHPTEQVREQARESYLAIRAEFLAALHRRRQAFAAHVRAWLRPVWGLLAFTEEELCPPDDELPSAGPAEAREAVPVGELLALLADLDASPSTLSDRLWHNDWQAYGKEERTRLRPALLAHPEALVRERAAWTLGEWLDAEALRELVRDRDLTVSKSAIYLLGLLPPTPSLAALAWEYLHRHDVLGVQVLEALDTFVRHATPAAAIRELGVIASDHGRPEGLRSAAMGHLAKLGAEEVVAQLAGLLHEPPAVTWALHIALLEALADLGLPWPDVRHLRAVDNLHLQVALVR